MISKGTVSSFPTKYHRDDKGLSRSQWPQGSSQIRDGTSVALTQGFSCFWEHRGTRSYGGAQLRTDASESHPYPQLLLVETKTPDHNLGYHQMESLS